MPTISIVTPVYNASNTLPRCAQSVFSQTYHDYEWVLVDDGSTDDSGALCDGYAAKHAFVHVKHTPNSGVSAARNTGMAMATGDYILFLDSDDFLDASMLETYAGATDKGRTDVVVGGLTVLEDGRETARRLPPAEGCFGKEIWESICKDSAIFGYAGGKMLRTAIVREHALAFRTDMQSQEDLEFLLSVYRFADTVCLLGVAGYQYAYSQGKRVPPVWDFIANQLKLIGIAQERTALSEQARTCVEERVAHLLFSCLHDATARGDYCQTARRLLKIDGLVPFLQTVSVKGEYGFAAKQFAGGHYKRLYRCFRVRRGLRRLLRRGR